MCPNSVVAVAAGGGGGSRTIEKRGQKAHFLVPRTENKNTWVLRAVQLHDAAMPGRTFSVILTNDDVLRCTTPRFRVLIMRGGRVLAEAKPDFCIRV